MALSEYQIALNNFNAAMNADPIIRALNEDRRAWGDIIYEEDMRTNPSPVRETMEQFTARLGLQTPPPAGEQQTFRSWNAHQPQRPPQRQQRFDQRPVPQQHKPAPQQKQHKPVPQQKQQKRPRNTFAALDEDSE